MKRLFIDIETSPNVVLSWRVGYKIKIDADNILKERAIICGCWKWQHQKQPKGITWDKGNDKRVVHALLDEMELADEVVAQNGDSFDVPWLKTRFLFHGGKSLPRFKTVDTLQWARRNFLFNSNRLDYMAGFLGIGNKIHTDFKLWKDVVLNNSTSALKTMLDYCKHDVVLLEKVWDRLQLVTAPKTHAAVRGGGAKWQCPRCCSENVQLRGKMVTTAGTISRRMQCQKCGGWFSINEKTYEDFIG